MVRIMKKPAARPQPEPEEPSEEEEEAVEEEEPQQPPLMASPPSKDTRRGGRGGRGRGRGSAPPAEAEAAPRQEESPATAAARAMVVTTLPSGAAQAEQAPAQICDGAPEPESPEEPGKLRVQYAPSAQGPVAPLIPGLVRLRSSGQLCDAAVVTGSGTIPVHRVVLAAHSEVLSGQLQGAGAELNLPSTSYEAAELLVRWLYGEIASGEYQPASQKVNEEILSLACKLSLPVLSDLCAARLAADVGTENVVAYVKLCEELGLPELRAAIVTALSEDGQALKAVAADPATLQHPVLMRELLGVIATSVGGGGGAAEGGSAKRARLA